MLFSHLRVVRLAAIFLSFLSFLAGSAVWTEVGDYNDEVFDRPGQAVFEEKPDGAALAPPRVVFQAGTPYRASDHDPVLVGLFQVADLSVTKADSPDPVTAGTNLTYTITVTNSGPDAADGTSWSDTLPAGTTFVALPPVAGWSCTTGGTVSCSNPSFAVGSAVFTLTVAVAPSVAASSVLSNTATVTSTTSDPDTAGTSATATTTVAASANLSVTKVDTPDPVTAGTNLTYTIMVTNAGPSNAASASISDTLPAGTTFVSLPPVAGWSCTTGGTVSCSNPSFAPGSAVFTLTGAVSPSVTSGTVLSNTVTASSATSDPIPGNESGTATTTVGAGSTQQPPGTQPPTSAEQDVFQAKLNRLKANAGSMPTGVADAIASLTGPVTKVITCPAGTTVTMVTVNITTTLVAWNTKLAAADSDGTYQWNFKSRVAGGKKTVDCQNWVMLDPAITTADEASDALGQIADEGLLYHELLHGQLLINAITADAAWQKKVCNCTFDLDPTDGDHSEIHPAQDTYLQNRAGTTANVTVVEAKKGQADGDRKFDIEVGPASKETFTYRTILPSEGGNIDLAAVTVEIVDGKFRVKGMLVDKTKPGKLFLRIDPPTQWLIAGIEKPIVILPAAVVAIPLLSPLGLGLMALSLVASGALLLRWRKRVARS